MDSVPVWSVNSDEKSDSYGGLGPSRVSELLLIASETAFGLELKIVCTSCSSTVPGDLSLDGNSIVSSSS